MCTNDRWVKPLLRAFQVIGTCGIISCEDAGVNHNTPAPQYAIENFGRIELSASSTVPNANLPITIATKFTSRVTGKGRLWIYGFGEDAATKVFVDLPRTDTISDPTGQATVDRVEIPFEVTSGQQFSQDWTIRFSDNSRFRIKAAAVIDSVYLQDSLRMYWSNSDTVQNHYRVEIGRGWKVTASSPDLVFGQ
jgi:hypothetical protein